ncbi:carboxypeptidase-like regulatory domain-containing protein [Pedobacter gandavensis]|uniref:TonB-dependent receptor n=1 Tax=Pedobacter gandavensis TaxID=2679963 RepID=A0ABR6ETH3_9SPHI|nr:carboxypeptidase-like regulatory domain-containing protein [Pedobacter gandavensis]MBB2148276.1 hypothetical protein [Pedobacter gandavensis]
MEEAIATKLGRRLQNICKYKLNIILILCLSSAVVCAQKKQINGVLRNGNGSGVANANIVLKNAKDYVMSFTHSNAKGEYAIGLSDTSSMAALVIELSCIGYETMQQRLSVHKYTYDFSLKAQSIDLKEVKIRSRPIIISKGDTLSYHVGSFSRPEDRSIGDVMKRLPGVSVAESGQISFNGKVISNLYIHGDDLMDGRYGLATKAIAKDMIKSIDVMQRFQPINVLKNKVFTDDVAINLVLKDEHSLKLAGQVMLGAGLPHQYDAAVNTMMFNKKVKVLNSLKANNSGIDMRNDFSQLGSSGFVKDVGSWKPNGILSLGTVGNPDLPKVNYYLNQSKLLNTNNLYNFDNGLQIKANVQLFLDQNKLNYTNSLDNYLNGDTLRYRERQGIANKPYSLNTSLTATLNKNTYFLNNKFSFNLDGNHASGDMSFNNENFNQHMKEKALNFFNDFSYTPALKNKNVVDMRWYVGYFNNPQQLNIDAGLNPELLNGGIPYTGILQSLSTPTFFSNAKVAYRIFNDHLIQQSYELGLINERQQFNSKLNLIQNNNSIADYKGDVGNDLSWQNDKVFGNAEYTVKKNKWRADLSLPLIGQFIHYKQYDYGLNTRKNQVFLNPNANLTVYLNAEDQFTVNYNFNNNFGKISNVYSGVVLANYRTISANHADLQEQKASNLALAYNFKRSIIMFFATARVDYKKAKANTIASTELLEDVQRTILLPYQNDQNTINCTLDMSKFIFALNTTISARAVLGSSDYNQLINDQLYPFKNKALTLQAKIESKFFGAVTLSYNGLGLWNESKQKPTEGVIFNINSKTKRFDQNLNIGFAPVNRLFVNLLGRHIYGSQSSVNYLFTDIQARYKLVKWRTDLELNISNLGNLKTYEVFSLSSNQFFLSRYEIRGRMGMIRATFNL